MSENKDLAIKSENMPDSVPYIVHEGEMARQERTIKKLWILIIVIFSAFIITNAGWIIREFLYEDIVVSQDIDTGDGDAIVSGAGDITYGEGKANGQNTP